MTLKDGNVLYGNELVQSFSRPLAKIAYNAVVADTDWVNSGDVGADVFTAAAGQESTVDTGVSTGFYESALTAYQLVNAGDAGDHTETPAETLDDTGTVIGTSYGYRFSALDTCVIVSATKHGTSTATSAILKTAAGVTLATASFSGNVATFATPYQLYTGVNYRIEGSAVGSYKPMQSPGAVTPTSQTNIKYEAGSGNGSDTSSGFVFVSIITQDSSFTTGGTVETNSITTLTAAPKSILVYGKSTLPAGTSITVDVSDDGGTSFDITGQALDSYIDTTALTGTSLALKFTLATTDTSVTPLLYGYSVVVSDR